MSEHRILFIESQCYISIDTGRLCIDKPDNGKAFVALQDIAVLVLHHPAITITGAALTELSVVGGIVLYTDQQHLPVAMQLPLANNVFTAARVIKQVERYKKPTNKRCWQQIVKNRISAQAAVLNHHNLEGSKALLRLGDKVKSGDAGNIEAQAARVYWQSIRTVTGVRREKQGADDLFNSHLNFGLAILRSLVARSICAAGLQPSLGVGHYSSENAFNLADDFLELYRGLIESHLLESLPQDRLNSESKLALASIIKSEITQRGEQLRLTTAITETINSYIRVLEGKADALLLPDWA